MKDNKIKDLTRELGTLKRLLSGKKPAYRLIDDSELLLTLYAANPDAGAEK